MLFFKIISGKKYDKLKKENKELSRELDTKVKYNNMMNDQIANLEIERNNIKYERDTLSKTNIDQLRQINSLIDTNKKLNEWIEKILNEVGIQELHEKTGVTIPVYVENPVRAYDGDKFDNYDFLKRKEIIIPELRFIKLG